MSAGVNFAPGSTAGEVVSPDPPRSFPGQPEGANNFRGRLVILSVDQLCPHPSYTKHRLSVSASQLTAISALDDLAFQQPIMVTQKGIVIDGYARLELARQQGRESVPCLEFELGEAEMPTSGPSLPWPKQPRFSPRVATPARLAKIGRSLRTRDFDSPIL
jgi:hypothetical protein